ncbi:hypothetical protein BC939DRAFT_477082 [Gamsiella multidivaricata]|uniref:uncharacterized protein n=1 Tax=Gamsiella multidivaricata TaxID=101098 RepID=UPI002220FD26|nr:uncharacterized protein BC939DRAFT_477082 [Gamsiella multidivaricata]KAG0351744.1 hypothetical protein BGZ54_003113 [Gamsiella multidivaricata]KAI7823529.1 hypothetical protein BC939DRAFT_477082 [Gamsiella multidivaricata]
MVKIISAAALVLATAISAAQAAFILSSGRSNGMHTVKGTRCALTTAYTAPTQTLKAGQVYCSYLGNAKMTLCQCHTADTSAKDQEGFIRDIVTHTNFLGLCDDKSGGVSYINAGSWINGFYEGPQNSVMRGAVWANGKQTMQCEPIRCSKPSEGLSWRQISSLSLTC